MKDPKPTFAFLVSQLAERHPDLAYLHLIEPRVSGSETRDEASVSDEWTNDFLREIWAPRPLISAGAYTRDSAIRVADTKGDLIAFGRQYISNVSGTFYSVYRLMLTSFYSLTFPPG